MRLVYLFSITLASLVIILYFYFKPSIDEDSVNAFFLTYFFKENPEARNPKFFIEKYPKQKFKISLVQENSIGSIIFFSNKSIIFKYKGDYICLIEEDKDQRYITKEEEIKYLKNYDNDKTFYIHIK